MAQLNYDTMRLRDVVAAPAPAAVRDVHRGASLSLPLLSGREAAMLLAGLADVVPVPVIVTDCGPQLRIAYGNAAWRTSRPAATAGGVEGRPFGEVLRTAGENPFLPVLWRACETGAPAHHRDFPCVALAEAEPCLPGAVTMWDWDVFPVLARHRGESRLLIALRDVTERHLRAARLRAAGEAMPGRPQEDLTAREMEVATLIAHGLRNPIIARKLHISRTTVASHVTRILQKLGFATRAQIAAWVVEQRMRGDVLAL
jgi:DNA-binding CsgD family transcriptional regulator